MKAFDKSKLPQVLDALAKNATVFAPIKNGITTGFAPYQSGAELVMDQNVMLSPKAALFPSTEKMYKFENMGLDLEITPLEAGRGSMVLFGLRSCDVQAVLCMDDVFLTKTFVDDYYEAKRKETTIVALGCTLPGPNCFCQSMGVNPQEHDKADVQMYDLGDKYGVEAQTEKGQALVKSIDSLLNDAGSASKPAVGQFNIEVDPAGVPEKLQKMFEHPIWNDLYKKCLNCGACTYLCPTCHCFDISEKKKNSNCGFKVRCWDSCMFNEYALMAGGHNPRPSKKERVRQRFMHKLRYFNERYGKYQCTGCGRCVAKCPVNLEITQVIEQVKEAKIDG